MMVLLPVKIVRIIYGTIYKNLYNAHWLNEKYLWDPDCSSDNAEDVQYIHQTMNSSLQYHSETLLFY